ncbi:MAG: STAS domain-containing protein [Rhodobiaceae bacterium]|jgi:hypothetical protein|nr:STAS domain-containing protein [Rhodobiaceae bacterium]
MSTPPTAPIDLSLPQWRDDPQLLKSELQARLGEAVVIDASVSRPVETLTAQLLLAARRAAEGANKPFEIQNPSEPFRDGLRVLGLIDELLGKGAAQ